MKLTNDQSVGVKVLSIINKLADLKAEHYEGDGGFHSVYGFKVGDQRVEFFKNTCKVLEITPEKLIETLKALAEGKKIHQFPCKGGFMIVPPKYLRDKSKGENKPKVNKSLDIFKAAIG